MAQTTRLDPYRNFRFRVEIDNISHAAFSEVEIGASTVDVVEYREGDEKATTVRKLPGLHKTGDVTFKRGVVSSLELFNWFKMVTDGHPDIRREVAIFILGEDGTDKAKFLVHAAWPRKIFVGELNAKGNDVAIEAIELANEGIERVVVT
jgi:phage tail-like protein